MGGGRADERPTQDPAGPRGPELGGDPRRNAGPSCRMNGAIRACCHRACPISPARRGNARRSQHKAYTLARQNADEAVTELELPDYDSTCSPSVPPARTASSTRPTAGTGWPSCRTRGRIALSARCARRGPWRLVRARRDDHRDLRRLCRLSQHPATTPEQQPAGGPLQRRRRRECLRFRAGNPPIADLPDARPTGPTSRPGCPGMRSAGSAAPRHAWVGSGAPAPPGAAHRPRARVPAPAWKAAGPLASAASLPRVRPGRPGRGSQPPRGKRRARTAVEFSLAVAGGWARLRRTEVEEAGRDRLLQLVRHPGRTRR